MQTPQPEDPHELDDKGAVAVTEQEGGDGPAPSSDGTEGERDKSGEEQNIAAPAMPAAKKKRNLPGTPGTVLHSLLAKLKPLIRKEH